MLTSVAKSSALQCSSVAQCEFFGSTDTDVNEYWIHEHYTGVARRFLTELLAAMKGPDYFCNDDSQSDYFHRSHYTDIRVGKWGKPYVYMGAREYA